MRPFILIIAIVGCMHTHFRPDCSGAVRTIYARKGIWLGNAATHSESDTAAIYTFVKEHGQIFTGPPNVGDLVFFDNTYDRNRDGQMNDRFTHIGIVENIFNDGTVMFKHYMHHRMRHSKMNDMLRQPTGKHKGMTAAELFMGFGRLSTSGLRRGTPK